MWQDDANDLICELSEQRNDIYVHIADLEYAIANDNEGVFIRIRDDIEEGK